MAVDWITRLGKKGFEGLIDETVQGAVERALQLRVEPRLLGIENRLEGMGGRFGGIESRLAGIEARFDVADRLARLDAEVSLLKSK